MINEFAEDISHYVVNINAVFNRGIFNKTGTKDVTKGGYLCILVDSSTKSLV